ncbi:hypothetical protein [Candidatus Phytoplasma australiense]|uniref:Uncharacterized protein n=1 Tax=Strawberry lethal yellows phytoplasma (CPA) str. NZSb11 TaxID=980422 RepID=R4S246_PHYAS|nr:hypothetical protein [Candidatus Phytoplasma australiense]AGL90889.1 Hypothetical Protein yibP [Strawberry lethal yellows phytoplasma (CPA) str. NZSb11]
MKQPNFFQKHLITIIIILLFGIAIIIGLFQGFNDYQNEKNSLSPLGQTPEKDSLEPENTPNSSRMKLSTEETPQPKIKTTSARLEKIKTYLFTEPTDTYKLPSDLSEREQEEINKLKNSWKLSLELLENRKTRPTGINKSQKECEELKTQLDSIQPKIEALKPQQQKLEQQKEAKEKEIKQKQEEKNLASPDDKIRLRAEIEKLQSEKQKIIEEISEVKLQIKKLESKQKYYQDMLSRAEKFKNDLVESYERQEKEYKNEILKSLNSLYEIIKVEE